MREICVSIKGKKNLFLKPYSHQVKSEHESESDLVYKWLWDIFRKRIRLGYIKRLYVFTSMSPSLLYSVNGA